MILLFSTFRDYLFHYLQSAREMKVIGSLKTLFEIYNDSDEVDEQEISLT